MERLHQNWELCVGKCRENEQSWYSYILRVENSGPFDGINSTGIQISYFP